MYHLYPQHSYIMLIRVKLHLSSIYLDKLSPGLMLLTTAMKAFPSLQLGPKSLTCDHEYHHKYMKKSEASIHVT